MKDLFYCIYPIIFSSLTATCMAETKTMQELEKSCNLSNHILMSGNLKDFKIEGKTPHLIFSISQPLEQAGGNFCKTDLKRDYIMNDNTVFHNQNDCSLISQLNQVDNEINLKVSLKTNELNPAIDQAKLGKTISYGIICGKSFLKENNSLYEGDEYPGVHFVHKATVNKLTPTEDGFAAIKTGENTYTLLNQ